MAEQGPVTACLLDGKGGGRELEWKEMLAWQPGDGLLWVHLDYTSASARDWLLEHSGLGEVAREALLSEDARPRSVPTQEGLLVNLRGVNLNPGQEPEDMVAIRVWCDGERVITSLRRHLMALDDLRTMITRGAGSRTPGEFLVDLAESMTHRMADVIEEIDDMADRLEEEVLTGDRQHLRARLADVRRQAIALRRYLSPQREALAHLQVERLPWLSDVDRIQLREVAERTTRFIEDLEADRERAIVTHEELTSRISEELESRMFMLTLIATIFLPLTFLTGLLGINVAGIPYSEKPWAFLGVCVLLGCLGGILYWAFKRRRWW